MGEMRMKILRTIVMGLLSAVTTVVQADDYTVEGQYVTIPVKQAEAGGAKVVRLQKSATIFSGYRQPPGASCQRNRA